VAKPASKCRPDTTAYCPPLPEQAHTPQKAATTTQTNAALMYHGNIGLFSVPRWLIQVEPIAEVNGPSLYPNSLKASDAALLGGFGEHDLYD
jgi:hypothetical protein